MSSGAAMDHPEPDLLFHLIASHHGYCRPLAPPIQDKEPEPFEIMVNDELVKYYGVNYPLAHISSGVAERFWKLTRRFGCWGLPYLELLLRLADQQESARIAKSFALVNPS
jgi:CRISPR-associated endonuclease/helicase Cas3